MNIKQLEKSQNIYQSIRTLDSEIIEIEKVASLIADGNAEVSLSFSVANKSNLEPSKEEEEAVFNPENYGLGSILGLTRGVARIEFNPFGRVTTEKKKPDHEIHSILSENLSLNVLAVLLFDKQQKRSKLISSLKRMGIEV